MVAELGFEPKTYDFRILLTMTSAALRKNSQGLYSDFLNTDLAIQLVVCTFIQLLLLSHLNTSLNSARPSAPLNERPCGFLSSLKGLRFLPVFLAVCSLEGRSFPSSMGQLEFVSWRHSALFSPFIPTTFAFSYYSPQTVTDLIIKKALNPAAAACCAQL